MNERFLELAMLLPGWTSADDGAYIGPQSSSLKLYTELVVNDCIRVINHGMDHTDYDDNVISMVEFLAQKWCRDAIKEHFGVK